MNEEEINQICKELGIPKRDSSEIIQIIKDLGLSENELKEVMNQILYS